MLFRPTESSQKIVDFYRGYLLTTFTTNNDKYNTQLKEALEKNKAIADGPYISMTDPYKKGKTLEELAIEGIVSKEIINMKSFHPSRPLYLHQEEAVRAARQGKNLVVTTGTGSGKTESFLIPVIDQLLREKEDGTLSPGVRTLIVYPMNALVNDQIRRIRELLTDYQDAGITFGKFTGETEDDYKKALKKYMDNGDAPLKKCELISREEMRAAPPNILITNYAMLEYMLLRPGDNIIFGDVNARKWRYIVFDEAHSYSGAKGIEVGTLIKRVKAMLGRKDIQFILTSATLGDKDSDDEIVRFGECLCNASFLPSGIIRSHTEEAVKSRESNNVPFEFYSTLADLIKDDASQERMLGIVKKFIPDCSENQFPDALFDIVLHDRFYSFFRNSLLNKVKNVRELSRELSVNEQQLTDFITVASSAHKNGEKLFEAKYHMFLRGIEGVFVTLKPNEKLFIHQMENYIDTNDNHEYKVYHVSFCSNCSALFIAAENEHGKLIQRSRANADFKPDIYLLSEEEYEQDDQDENGEDIFYVCSRCGEIKHTIDQLNCGHGSSYAAKLRRIKKKGEELHKCPCCHSVDNQRSIVRPYFLGSEAATSVIATALYNELPGKTVIKGEQVERKGLFGGTIKTAVEDKVKYLTKQFLAFSDNRQAAAFFASYMQYTYNLTIVKRIMTEIISNNENLSLYRFAERLKEKIGEHGYNIGRNSTSYDVDAWVYILKEMSNFKAKNSLLSLGILQFEFSTHFPDLNDGEIKLNAEDTNVLIHILLRDLIRNAVIDVEGGLGESDWENISVSGGRKLFCKEPSTDSQLISWLPEEGKTNKRVRQVVRYLGISDEKATEFLSLLWDTLIDSSNPEYCVLEKVSMQKYRRTITGYAIKGELFSVNKPNRLYWCTECRKITPYHLKGICENPSCNGRLVPYDASSHQQNRHYRLLYTTLDITPMKIVEHTAQLSTQKAAEYQRNFKDKKINVLSCSTTFEMGVDVGSLETVFMRNMPPTPANYAQRAGRAGRSFYSAAYALTYCPNSSHDLNYFKNPVQMIKGNIRPPYFNMENYKIVLRHMISTALSCFWREKTEYYYKQIGDFMDNRGFVKFREYLLEHPLRVKEFLNVIVPDELKEYYDINNFGWVKDIFAESENDPPALCDIAISKYNEEMSDLEKERKLLIESGRSGVDGITYSIRTLREQGIIDFLSKNNIIPKYGFPVDTVELRETGDNKSPLRLSRDLFTAISEYAPGSQVVADGKLITSRYIRRLKGYEWPTYKYVICSECHTINSDRNLDVVELKKCRQCGKDLPVKKSKYLIPMFGFMSEPIEKKVTVNKPERTYHGAISYVGDEKKITYRKFDVNGTPMLVGNSKMDSLIVLNESNFYVCKTCGYTEIRNKDFSSYVETDKTHKNPSGYDCKNKGLYRYSLGHEFKTDVIMIKFPMYYKSREPAVAWTILYSMLEGLSRCLNIDRNELSGCLQWYHDEEYDIGNFGYVLFDNTPGGAGYVRELDDMEIMKQMLMNAYQVVDNCDCGGELKDTACYSCLCNYYNQKQHDLLKRKYAIDFFKELLCGRDGFDIIPVENSVPDEDFMIVQNESDVTGKLRVELCGKGRTVNNKELWEELLEDYSDDSRDTAIIEKLRDMTANTHISDAIYNEFFVLPELSEEQYMASVVWQKERIMLFMSDMNDEYNTAKEGNWKCFSTTEGFDIDQFIIALGGK